MFGDPLTHGIDSLSDVEEVTTQTADEIEAVGGRASKMKKQRIRDVKGGGRKGNTGASVTAGKTKTALAPEETRSPGGLETGKAKDATKRVAYG